MYEPRHKPPIPRRDFFRRVIRHFLVALGVVTGSVLAGMAGYAFFEGLGWRDGFLEAAMLLGGMGPIKVPQTPGGKMFAGLYALYAGMIFLVAVAIILAPVFHRIMHRYHWDTE